MGKLTSALAVLIAVAPLSAQQPATPAPPATLVPQIVATGEGEARFTPDRATIAIGVQTRAATAAQAAAENARKQRAVIDTLRTLGIPNELISTVDYNVYPEQRYNPQQGDQSPKIVGYNVSNTVRVEVRNLDRIGQLIDAALAKGGNQINSLNFYASNTDSARHSALAEAVQKARSDAEAIAKAAGGRLGELLDISEAGYAVPPPRPVPYAMAKAAEAAPTPINPGEQSLNVGVVARWRFVAGS